MGHGMGCPICDTMMRHHMGHHGMGGKGGMMGMFMKPCKVMMIGRKLGLSDDQIKKMRDRLTDMKKQKVKIKCDLKLRKIDMMGMLMQEQVNMQEVEAKVREIMNLKADMKLAWIQAMQDAKGMLTPDQREKAKEMMMSWCMKGGMGGEEGPEEEEEEPEEESEEEE